MTTIDKEDNLYIFRKNSTYSLEDFDLRFTQEVNVITINFNNKEVLIPYKHISKKTSEIQQLILDGDFLVEDLK